VEELTAQTPYLDLRGLLPRGGRGGREIRRIRSGREGKGGATGAFV